MAYAVNNPGHETLEQIEKNAIIVFSPEILDERIWNVAKVVAAPAEGALEYAWLSYNGYQNYTEGDFPVTVPLGETVSATVQYANKAAYSQYMKCTVEFIDPDGNSRGENHSTFNMGAYAGRVIDTDDVVIDKEGTWKIHAILETYP